MDDRSEPDASATSVHSAPGLQRTNTLRPGMPAPSQRTSSSYWSPLANFINSRTGQDSFSAVTPRATGPEQTGIFPAQSVDRANLGFSRGRKAILPAKPSNAADPISTFN